MLHELKAAYQFPYRQILIIVWTGRKRSVLKCAESIPWSVLKQQHFLCYNKFASWMSCMLHAQGIF